MSENEINFTFKELEVEGLILQQKENEIARVLSKLDGIKTFDISDNKIKLSFISDIVSINIIKEEIEKNGLKIISNKKKLNPFTRLINRLIKSNEKNFGSKTLDCCNLNKKNVNKKS